MADPKDIGTKRMLLIIIDQLRADYLKHLSKCSRVLPYPAVCDTGSFPASTEAMHTNISTGMYPKDHGFISKTLKDGAAGLEQLIWKLRRKEISSLASLGSRYDFNTCVIGGKQETVQVMGYGTDCTLMVYYDKKEEKFKKVISRNDIEEDIDRLLLEHRFSDLNQEQWDTGVFDIFNAVNVLPKIRIPFFILTLSSLDNIGHDYGPHSKEIYRHLSFLDESIISIMENLDNSSIIITGDHGCRLTTKYLIEPSKDNPSRIAVYEVVQDSIKFDREYKMRSYASIRDMQYDGGILRVWLNEKGSLCKSDINFLSEQGYVFPQYVEQGHADKQIIQLYENSRHENLGDVFVVAKGDTTFCKLGWIRDIRTREKVDLREDLTSDSLPIGEHGTYHSEDRQVCFLSNVPISGTMLNNTDIYNFIECIMKK